MTFHQFLFHLRAALLGAVLMGLLIMLLGMASTAFAAAGNGPVNSGGEQLQDITRLLPVAPERTNTFDPTTQSAMHKTTTLNLPQTATAASLQLILGLCFLGLAVVVVFFAWGEAPGERNRPSQRDF